MSSASRRRSSASILDASVDERRYRDPESSRRSSRSADTWHHHCLDDFWRGDGGACRTPASLRTSRRSQRAAGRGVEQPVERTSGADEVESVFTVDYSRELIMHPRRLMSARSGGRRRGERPDPRARGAVCRAGTTKVVRDERMPDRDGGKEAEIADRCPAVPMQPDPLSRSLPLGFARCNRSKTRAHNREEPSSSATASRAQGVAYSNTVADAPAFGGRLGSDHRDDSDVAPEAFPSQLPRLVAVFRLGTFSEGGAPSRIKVCLLMC